MLDKVNLLLDRIYKAETYTIGKLYIDGVYFCDTLEDKVRDINKDGDLLDKGEEKVYGETAIPSGTYQIVITYSNRFKKPLPLLESSLSSSLAEGYNHYEIFDNIKLIDLPSRYQSKLNLGNSIILSSGLYYAYRYLSLIGSGAYITFKNGSSSDLEYLFCLCVKKGYERYIQLCIITKTEIEFDCLYFMYRKDLVNEHNNQIYKFLFNKVMKYCKDYKIETIPVDDLTLELNYSVDLLSGVKNRVELNERCDLIKEQALLNF